MSRKVFVQGSSSPFAKQMLPSMPDGAVVSSDGIACESLVHVDQAYIAYGVPGHAHRPYLKLFGEVRQASGDFPCDVSEVTFGEGKGPEVSFEFGFTDSQLSQLCAKGLFHEGFSCPDIFYDNDFYMPVVCSCHAVVPQQDGDAPLLFVGLEQSHSIPVDTASTGYDLAEYFEEYVPSDEKEKDSVLQQDYEFSDMFEEDDEAVRDESVQEQQETDAGVRRLADKSPDVLDAALKQIVDNVRHRDKRTLTPKQASDAMGYNERVSAGGASSVMAEMLDDSDDTFTDEEAAFDTDDFVPDVPADDESETAHKRSSDAAAVAENQMQNVDSASEVDDVPVSASSQRNVSDEMTALLHGMEQREKGLGEAVAESMDVGDYI